MASAQGVSLVYTLEVKCARRWHKGQRTRCVTGLHTGGQVRPKMALGPAHKTKSINRLHTKGPMRPKMAQRPAQSTSIRSLTLYNPHAIYAQPPAVGQPLLACWQHHAFLGTDQPACQFEKPALQS